MTKELIHYIAQKYWDVRSADRKKVFKGEIKINTIVATLQKKHVQIAIGRYNGDEIIFILGSNEFMDWMYNLSFPLMKTPYKGSNKKIKMHRGFYKSYLLIREDMHKIIKDRKKIIIMGQSFGAAIATIMALDFQYNFPSLEIECMTTGSPRVGNGALAASYDKRVPATTRYVYGHDIVPLVPFGGWGFKHVGLLIKLGKRGFFPSVKNHLFNKGYLKEL